VSRVGVGAAVFNLGGSAVRIADWIAAIEDVVPESEGLITADPTPLPFPPGIEHGSLAALGAERGVPVGGSRADAAAMTARSAH
jgi:hypothetical protein